MATEDYASPAQARLMRAVAHGWKPKNPRGRLPSRAVAEEFVEKKDRKQLGGLALATPAVRRAARRQATPPPGDDRTEAQREAYLRMSQLPIPTSPETGMPGFFGGMFQNIAQQAQQRLGQLDPTPGGAAPDFRSQLTPGFRPFTPGVSDMRPAPTKTVGMGQPGGLAQAGGPGGQVPGRGPMMRDPSQSFYGRSPALEGMMGGPRIPPALQGYLQMMRMRQRPGGGGNRIGMGDQQGALARALQRGTGRPPMSRRRSFPGMG